MNMENAFIVDTVVENAFIVDTVVENAFIMNTVAGRVTLYPYVTRAIFRPS